MFTMLLQCFKCNVLYYLGCFKFQLFSLLCPKFNKEQQTKIQGNLKLIPIIKTNSKN